MLPDLPEPTAPAADSELLTPEETAAQLKISQGYLARLRVEGGGPRYVKLAKRVVRYRPVDVRDYVVARLRASTSDRGE